MMDSRRERGDNGSVGLRRVASVLSFLLGAIVLGLGVVQPTVALVHGVNVYPQVAVFMIVVSTPFVVWFVRLGLTLAGSGPVSERSRIPVWLLLAAGGALVALGLVGVGYRLTSPMYAMNEVDLLIFGLGFLAWARGITYGMVLRRARRGSRE